MKKRFSLFLMLAGLCLLALGFVLLRVIGGFTALPYLCIGLGCGAMGHGAGELIKTRLLRRDPDLEKQQRILRDDERNVAIGDRAKARAYDAMVYVFAALILAFALMNVPLSVLLPLIAAYLCIEGIAVYFRIKLEKEM